MMVVTIPGFGSLRLGTLVCDYNGTLARDGRMLEHVGTLLPRVAQKLRIHVVTGDTFGTAHRELARMPCEISIMPLERQAEAKLEFIHRLGAGEVVAIGNGRNDHSMLAAAALGIAVIGDEGVAAQALQACDVAVRHAVEALELLLEPQRLIATLRS
jgi:P-type E1-E2 ATPase